MKAELKELYSLDCDISVFAPTDPSTFGLWLTAMIGVDSESRSESFDIFVCSPDWLRSKCLESDAVWGRHMLILGHFDENTIRSAIQKYLATCSGATWTELGKQISRIGAWEFEDYKTD